MEAITITVTSTEDFVSIDGVPCRMWDGTTSTGIPVQACIPRVAPRHATEVQRKEFGDLAIAAGFRPPDYPDNRAQVIEDLTV